MDINVASLIKVGCAKVNTFHLISCYCTYYLLLHMYYTYTPTHTHTTQLIDKTNNSPHPPPQ